MKPAPVVQRGQMLQPDQIPQQAQVRPQAYPQRDPATNPYQVPKPIGRPQVMVKNSSDETKMEEEAIMKFSEGILDVKDIIAPPAIEIDFNHLQIGSKFFRTFFCYRFSQMGWG